MWTTGPRCQAGAVMTARSASAAARRAPPSRPGDASRAPSMISPIRSPVAAAMPDVGGPGRRGRRRVDPLRSAPAPRTRLEHVRGRPAPATRCRRRPPRSSTRSDAPLVAGAQRRRRARQLARHVVGDDDDRDRRHAESVGVPAGGPGRAQQLRSLEPPRVVAGGAVGGGRGRFVGLDLAVAVGGPDGEDVVARLDVATRPATGPTCGSLVASPSSPGCQSPSSTRTSTAADAPGIAQATPAHGRRPGQHRRRRAGARRCATSS